MFQIVPRRVTGCSIELILLCFFDEGVPAQATLELRGAGVERVLPLSSGPWNTLHGDSSSIRHSVCVFGDLPAATSCEVVLRSGERELARAYAETLPVRLALSEKGSGPDRPFTLWLSSCFYAARAPRGLEQMVESVVRDERIKPHLKILAGDQVYLDFPQTKTLLFDRKRLARHFNEVYASSWTHPAFAELLRNGGTLFLVDDHELWNNYPDSPVPLLWRLRGKSFHTEWERLAKERCAALQSVQPLERIEIGAAGAPELLILAAQTRLERSHGKERIMSDEAMARLVSALRGLTCPAVLALTQPIFADSNSEDFNLTDYRQYRELLQPALTGAPHDIVVVTGDPHFGRIGVVRYADAQGARQLIEVVASPLTLVTPLSGCAEPPLPGSFPHYAAGSRTIEYPRVVANYRSGRYTLSEEHAMLLRFWRDDTGHVRLRVMLRLARQDSPAEPWSWDTTLT